MSNASALERVHIPNARLCKAPLDRITDRAHIIETGTESYRFRRTMERRRNKQAAGSPRDPTPRSGEPVAQGGVMP